MTDEQGFVVVLTDAERRALLEGLAYVNAYFGRPPDPPTPGMTAAAKLLGSQNAWDTLDAKP